ncbi:MAG: hypothetical protein HY741_02175, partial [Chloroflexi bacterium]|nr:hypothetical protein [Chloroflexota bacterium]
IVLDLTYDECTPIQDEFINVECTDGALAFTRKETQGTRWIYYRPVLTDTLIELTARLPSQKNGRYGVMFRVDEAQDNFYILGVSNAGKYGLFRFAQDHYETIIPYTDSFNVGNAGFPTKIKIVNQGDVIAVNLGGQWEASIRDANLTEGKIALFFEPDEPNQTVLFDDLRVTALSTPMEVPQPSVVTPPATATTTGNQLPVLDLDTTPTTIPAEPTTIPAEPTTIPAEPTTILVAPTSQPQPTQTPIIIVVTAMPPPTAVPPTRAATRRPTQAACPAAANEALLYVSNNYQGTTMRFTIGGGEWGTHDYDVPGDGKYYRIHMPPGTYTYTAFIAGQGTAHGEKTAYLAGRCYSLRFSPN